MSTISADEVSTAIKHLKLSTGLGPDGISSFLINGCSQILIPLLVHIFTISFTSQIFPSLCKRSVVIPIYNKGSSFVVSNYRLVYLFDQFFKNFQNHHS